MTDTSSMKHKDNVRSANDDNNHGFCSSEERPPFSSVADTSPSNLITHNSNNLKERICDEGHSSSSLNLNEVMLQQAVAAAGSWAYGAKAVEVWLFDENDEGGRLKRPGGGLWRDPVFPKSRALSQIEDPDVEGYIPTKRLVSGEGMAGVLWAESHTLSSIHHPNNHGKGLMIGRNFLNRGANNNGATVIGDEEEGGAIGGSTASKNGLTPPTTTQLRHGRKVVWRNLKTLANDPFQPPNRRLKLWVEAGFGLAAGVTFEARASLPVTDSNNVGTGAIATAVTRGLVIFMARDTVDLQRLKSLDNESYMMSAADLIGAELALSPARMLVVRQRQEEREELLRRVRLKLRAVVTISKLSKRSLVDQFGLKMADEKIQTEDENKKQHIEEDFRADGDDRILENQSSKTWIESCGARCTKAASSTSQSLGRMKDAVISLSRKVLTKSKGSGPTMSPPPPVPDAFAFATFGGVLLTMTLLCGLNYVLKLYTSKKIVLGPFGALLTLQFGLMAAPVAQPRNALYGQLISMVIAILVTYLPAVPQFSEWFYPALATALAVGAMVRLGIAHPPGGASALLFVSQKLGWVEMCIMLAANAIAIVCATIYNNCLDKRKYPIYWSLDHGIPFLETSSYGGIIKSRVTISKKRNNCNIEGDLISDNKKNPENCYGKKATAALQSIFFYRKTGKDEEDVAKKCQSTQRTEFSISI